MFQKSYVDEIPRNHQLSFNLPNFQPQITTQIKNHDICLLFLNQNVLNSEKYPPAPHQVCTAFSNSGFEFICHETLWPVNLPPNSPTKFA